MSSTVASGAMGLDPSSELSQMLTSLGLATVAGDGNTAAQGPDPLVVARAKLAKLKRDLEHTAELLRRVNATQKASPLAIRLSPPVTNGSVGQPPVILRLSSEAATWEQALKEANSDSATYLPFADHREALHFLRTIYSRTLEQFEGLRREVVSQAQQRIQQTMQAAASADGDYVVNEDGQALNEDGLPFVDPTESVAEVEPKANDRGRGSTLEKFEPSQNLTGEARRRWIEDTFKRFEGRAEDEPEDEDTDAASSTDTDAESGSGKKQMDGKRAQSHSQVPADLQHADTTLQASQHHVPSSLDSSGATVSPRNAPLKSALKRTAKTSNVQPHAKFGHSGLRKGFLNMNPSSPAAIASSNPIDQWQSDAAVTPSESGSSVTASSRPASERQEEKEVDAMTKSVDPSAVNSSKVKKSVRIQSPERDRSRTSAAHEIRPTIAANDVAHPDDLGVEDEAARIVELLGPQVVQGTERGDEALQSLQRAQEAAQKEAARQIRESKEAKQKQEDQARAYKTPAVGAAVVERSQTPSTSGGASLQSSVDVAKQSAWKRGFLNRPPPKSAPATSSQGAKGDQDPRKSLGMSALDRSLLADEEMSSQRESQGLPAPIPHARPSKAYQERLKKREEGALVEEKPSNLQPSSQSTSQQATIVGTGRSDGQGASKVRFALETDATSPQPLPITSESVHEVDSEGEEEGLNLDDVETELDEHDEEEFVRAAYASGDTEESEAGRQDGDEDSGDEGGSDWSLESYDYTASDLADLEPTFNGLVSDLESRELAREYALAKAQQLRLRQNMTDESRAEMERAFTGEKLKEEERQRLDDENPSIWQEEDIDGRDIAAAMDMDQGLTASERKKRATDPPNRMSRFKASRIVQALAMGPDAATAPKTARAPAGWVPGAREDEMVADQAGHELAHLLDGAQNVGPSADIHRREPMLAAPQQTSARNKGPVMVLPSLTPLRYPRTAPGSGPLTEDSPIPREGVDLEGETDEDEEDETLMDVMRARLQERDARRLQGDVEPGSNSLGDQPSSLRAAGRGRQVDEEDSLRGVSGMNGRAMEGPPSLLASKGAPKTGAQQDTNRDVIDKPTLEGSEPLPSSDPVSAAPKMSRFKAARLAAQQK
ncbi:unnamed protein product [Parajaminaea phylloscopi]